MGREDDFPRTLVLGATGPVGRELLVRLAAAQPPVRILALSRAPPAELDERIAWRRGDLCRDAITDPVDAVLSAGPLDGLADWLERQQPQGIARVVALSSTSLHVKAGSRDARERDVAARLRAGEERLAAWCVAHGAHWTILRPTLVYGDGDRNLARVAALATRFGCFVLPRGARGLRQPVHAHDVAGALLACLDARATFDRAYDLPGGETLAYDAMIARLLATLPSRPRLLRLPDSLFAVGAAIARPFVPGATPAVLARLRDDLAFDAGDATRDFGYAPRAFAGAASAAILSPGSDT